MNAESVCANCGSPVVVKLLYGRPRLVCPECGTRRQDQSALAPSPSQIETAKREIKERAMKGARDGQ